MDSVDAQCLVMQTLEGEISPPDLWRHERSGALSCAYKSGENTFTWPPEDVAEMARTWRESGSNGADQAQPFVDLHRRLETIIEEAGRDRPDTIIHDLRRAELKAVWEDPKVVIVVDGIPEGASSQG